MEGSRGDERQRASARHRRDYVGPRTADPIRRTQRMARPPALSALQAALSFTGPHDNEIQVWFESCNTPNAGQGDIIIPVSFPGIDWVLPAQPVSTPPPPLLVIRTGTDIQGKTGLTNAWATINPSPTADVRVSGQRITWTGTNGHLFAKDGPYGSWYDEYASVSQYAASSSLLVVRDGNNLHGKVTVNDNWTWSINPTPAVDVQVTGNRISYTDTNGNIWAKDGLTGTWYQEYSAVSQYAASPSLFVIRGGTGLHGKTCLTCNWVWSFNATPATDVRVSDNRITYTDTNGHLYAKDGLTGTWYDEYPSVSQYAASSSLLVIRTGTALNGKVGLTDNWTWSFNPTPAVDVKVSGNRIMYTDTNGHLWVKDGLTGAWVDEYAGVDQYVTS